MIVKSARFTLVKEDYKKWLINALIFLGPALVVLIGSVIDILPKDAKWYAVAIYLANTVLDLFQKWLKEHKYQV